MNSPEEPAGVASAALTPIEQQLAEIWRAVLRIEDVGPDDNFASLGGDSVMMMLVLSRVHEQFGVELDQSVLLQVPTLRQLAELIASPGAELVSEINRDGIVSGVI